MSFPHHALRKSAETATIDGESVLDAVRARQAKSRTVRALRQAEHSTDSKCDDLAARIHYFAAETDAEMTVRGSFWQTSDTAKIDENAVYQSDSANIKVEPLSPSGTGPDLNLTGHGAEKSHD